jgi:hypothetical protein
MTFLINDNGVDRPMTDAEIAELKELQANAAIQLKAKQDAEAAKETAKSKLEALGLTIDDLKALGL